MEQLLRRLVLHLHRDVRFLFLLGEQDLLRVDVNVLLLVLLRGARALSSLRLDEHRYLLAVLGEGVPQLDRVELSDPRTRQDDLLLAEDEEAAVEVVVDRLGLVVQLLRRHEVRVGRSLVR